MNKLHIVCCSRFYGDNWNWFAPVLGDQLHWHFFHDKPRGLLEKYIKQPNLAIIRASLQAVYFAKQHHPDLLITHDARIAFWCGLFAAWLGLKTEIIAWSFNFPDLPVGVKRRLMAFAFKNITEFTVYSTLEKQVYTQYFGIPAERIKMLLWNVAAPEVHPEEPLEGGDYICAVGSNMRDYQTLIAAMEKLPDVRLVLVARPNNLKKISIPHNVKVWSDIPSPHAMNIIKHSRFMVLPLLGSKVPCGHITIVAAMHLGKAFIVTKSAGVSDYVFEDFNSLTCEPSAPDALAKEICNLWENPDKCQQLGTNGKQFALKNCVQEVALQHLQHQLFERKLLS